MHCDESQHFKFQEKVYIMPQFPDPVLPPVSVFETRQERLRQLVISCLYGVGIRSSIIAAELIGVFYFGSASLLMDALSSIIDIVSSVFLVICIRLAARPPDANHPFGHGRYEPLVGLQLGLLMMLTGAGMFFHQVFALSAVTSSEVVISNYAWVIPLCAVILLEISYQVVISTAKRQNSPALAADAIHYRIDSLTSVCAAMALLAAAYFPAWSHSIDHMGAILIAIVMVCIGVYATKQNLNQVMDHIPDQEYFDRVKKAAMRVDGVHETEKTRIQLYGPDAHIDIDIEVDPKLSVEVAHEISQKVRVEIQKEWPLVQDVTVHIEPYYPNDH